MIDLNYLAYVFEYWELKMNEKVLRALEFVTWRTFVSLVGFGLALAAILSDADSRAHFDRRAV